MIFFFSSKIGPKDSKFGILYSQRQHNDNQLHQIRSQTLSSTTVPFELSASGKILPQIAFFVSLPKNAIEMFTKNQQIDRFPLHPEDPNENFLGATLQSLRGRILPKI